MTERSFSPQPTARLKPNYSLIFQVMLLLGFAICLRLFFFTGPIYDESYEVVKGAYELVAMVKENLQSGSLFELLEIPSVIGWKKLSGYVPVSLFYLIGGVSDYTSIAFVLISSILNLILLFFVVRLQYGIRVALVSLFLWAFIPKEIALATIPSLNTVFLPVLLSSFLVFVIGLKNQKLFLVGLGGLVGLALLVFDNVLGSYLLLILATYFIWQRGYSWIVWYGLLGLAIAVVFMYGSNALLAGYRTFVGSTGGLELIVTLIIAIAATRSSKKKPISYTFAGVATTFLFLIIRQQTPSSFEFSYEIEIIFWAISMLIVANYLAPFLDARTIKKFLTFSLPFILLLLFLSKLGQETLLPDYRSPEHIGSTLLLSLKVLSGFTMLIVIVSPLFLVRTSQVSIGISLLLLVSFGLSLFAGIQQEKEAQPYRLSNVYRIIHTIQDQYMDLPIYVDETRLLNLLHYTSKFNENSQVFSFGKKTQIDNGFVIVREGSLADVPSDWAQVDVIGRLGQPRLTIFRVLQPEFAKSELATSKRNAQENPTSFNLYRLYRAYMNVDEQCRAYYVWLQALAVGGSDIFDYLIIESNNTCFTYKDEEDLFNGLFQANQGNSFFESGNVYSNQIRVRSLEDEGAVRIFHWNKAYPDPRIFDLEIILEPGKVYLYEATIRSRALVTSLYWGAEGEEFAALTDHFPNWRNISILLATPNWAEPTGVRLSPVLFDHFAYVDLKDAHLIEIDEINSPFDFR